MFRDRTEAARKLSQALLEYKGSHPLVLAIPRGAVPMGKIIADALGGELDVVLVRKLGAPRNEEYAIGSIDESGRVYLNPDVPEDSLPPDYLQEEQERQKETMRARRSLYTPVRPPIDPAGKMVIIIDDGMATGSTMIGAVESVRSQGAEEIIVAVPVASREAVKIVEAHADRVVCLHAPLMFAAVAQFYDEFPQVSDEEVVKVLKG